MYVLELMVLFGRLCHVNTKNARNLYNAVSYMCISCPESNSCMIKFLQIHASKEVFHLKTVFPDLLQGFKTEPIL